MPKNKTTYSVCDVVKGHNPLDCGSRRTHKVHLLSPILHVGRGCGVLNEIRSQACSNLGAEIGRYTFLVGIIGALPTKITLFQSEESVSVVKIHARVPCHREDKGGPVLEKTEAATLGHGFVDCELGLIVRQQL